MCLKRLVGGCYRPRSAKVPPPRIDMALAWIPTARDENKELLIDGNLQDPLASVRPSLGE
jgi:hypothetical protein